MIEFAAVTKSYGRKAVLHGVTATVPSGMVTALVGPNAAGKTTLLKCLLGLVLPDGGEIRVDGELLDREGRARAGLGYMPQRPSFPENLTVSEFVLLLKDVRGQPAVGEDALVEFLGLAPFWEVPLRALSGGTRQKVSAFGALLFAPELLVLDEPSAGLDPASSIRLKDRIAAERAQGRTILLTSHYVSELEGLADNLLILLDGRVHFAGPPELLKARFGEAVLERAVARSLTAVGDAA